MSYIVNMLFGVTLVLSSVLPLIAMVTYLFDIHLAEQIIYFSICLEPIGPGVFLLLTYMKLTDQIG